MKVSRRASLAAIVALSLAPAVRAAPFDGSQPLICAPIEILECERMIRCETQSAEAVDLPQFIRISVADKTVTGTRPSGTPVDAKISHVEHNEKQMYIQGIQKRFGWSAAIDEEKGSMTMTIHDQASGYVIFGACTPR